MSLDILIMPYLIVLKYNSITHFAIYNWTEITNLRMCFSVLSKNLFEATTFLVLTADLLLKTIILQML